jgi:hypothetical protein
MDGSGDHYIKTTLSHSFKNVDFIEVGHRMMTTIS